jgi:DNA-directed RNA polymerase beta subunit
MGDNNVEEVIDAMRILAKNFFKFQPPNRFVIDSYDYLVTQGLHDILRRSAFYFNNNQEVGKVSFENIFVLPPMKGDPNPETLGITAKSIFTIIDGVRTVNKIPEFLASMKREWFTAFDARRDNDKYMLTVYADIKVEKRQIVTTNVALGNNTNERLVQALLPEIYKLNEKSNNSEQIFKFVKLFEFPLMTGSLFDWPIFSGASPEEYSLFGECINDPFASFTMRKNKVFVTQEKLAPNIARTIVMDKDTVCTFRSESLEKRSVNVRLMFWKRDKSDPGKICTIYLPFMTKGKEGKQLKMSEINVLWIFRFYAIWALLPERDEHGNVVQVDTGGITSIDIMMSDVHFYLEQCTSDKSKKAYTEIVSHLIPTILHAKEQPDDVKFIELFANAVALPSSLEHDMRLRTMKNLFDADLFPHVYLGTAEDYQDYSFDFENRRSDVFPRFYTLISMIVQFVKSYYGYKDLADRDSFGTKMLATVGVELSTLIEKGFRHATAIIRKNLSGTTAKSNISNIATEITNQGEKQVTSPVSSSFISMNWGLKRGNRRPGVVQMEDPTSLMGRWELIRKLSIPASSKSKLKKPRMVQETGYGIVDPTKTVDSDKVGLIKYLACSVYVSNNNLNAETYAVSIAAAAAEDELVPERLPGYLPLFINHTWQGFAKKSLFERFRNEKRAGRFGNYTEVYENVEIDELETVREYHIVTTGGRAMRPVFVVKDGEFPALKYLRFPEVRDLRFETLLREGMVQYISANEAEFSDIAMDYKQFLAERDIRNFDYMEIDPSFQFGLSALTQPDAQMNPIPRIMFYGLMSHQPMGFPMSTFGITQPKDMKILNYSQKPLVSSDIINVLGLDQQGFGTNVTIFVMPKAGTDEDATAWNKSFFERGGFNSTFFETYSVEAQAFVPDANDDITRYANGVITTRIRTEGSIDPKEREIIEASGIGARQEEEEEEEEEEESDDSGEEQAAFRTNDEWPIRGVPKVVGPNLVRPKDVLMRYKTSLNSQAEVRELTLKGVKSGFIHSTHRSNLRTMKLQKVVVRFPHVPSTGDKFANRHSQKGVLGAVVPEVDLPFTDDGRIPDVVFSPPSFSSRMTVAMFSEMLRGKAASVCNRNHFVNRLVQLRKGFTRAVINNDFHILLEYILVSKNPSATPDEQYILISKIRKEVENSSDMKVFQNLSGQLRENKIDELVEKAIDSKPYANYKRAYGLKFRGNPIYKNIETFGEIREMIVGYRITYEVPNQAFIATLKTGEKGILFSKLPSKLQFEYYKIHENDLVPAYRIPSAKDSTKLEAKLRDATPFRPISIEEIGKILEEKGYSSHGKQWVTDGRTGIRSQAMIFTGPCYYMALKHVVEKKEQVRDQGSISINTRAPTKGKSLGGAPKKEEMQRVVALAHGSNKFLKEAFMTAADEYKTLACQRCGNFCYLDARSDLVRCETCNDKAEPYKVTIPWATVKLISAQRAAGLDIRMNLQPMAIDDDEDRGRDAYNVEPMNPEVNIYKLDDEEEL